MLVFLDGHVAAGAFALFQQVHVAIRRFLAGVGVELPAAGIGAGALVGVAVVEVAREQAAPGIGDAQRAMHEDLKLHVRTFLADLGDLVEREFARKNDAADAELFPEPHCRVVDGVGLHRKVDGHVGPGLANHVDQARVGHDQRVRLEGDDRRHVRQVGFDFGVVRKDVADDVEPLAQAVRVFDADAQRNFIAEAVVAHAQAVARLAGIHRIGAEGERGFQHGLRAGGGQQFGLAYFGVFQAELPDHATGCVV